MVLRQHVLALALHITRGTLHNPHLVHLLWKHLLIRVGILLNLIIKSIVPLLRNLFGHLVSGHSTEVSSGVNHTRSHAAHRDLFLLVVQII